jgi:hypothetical protein
VQQKRNEFIKGKRASIYMELNNSALKLTCRYLRQLIVMLRYDRKVSKFYVLLASKIRGMGG